MGPALDIKRLIFIPGLVTLAVTGARLAGELLHGPRRFFNSDPGGPWSVVGIIWLAPIWGIYFARKLAANGQGPQSPGRALGFAVRGVMVVIIASLVGPLLHLQQHF